MNQEIEFRVAWCPVCNQGWIEVVKDINTKQLFLCCKECETEWDNPDKLKNPRMGTHDKYGKIETPSYEEVLSKGWKIIL
jgi:formate dehydrogenase maturation protein FdhE